MTIEKREQFNTMHGGAFEFFNAHPPGRGWSAFDVERVRAKKEAKFFVTSIWNFGGPRGRGYERANFAIRRDKSDGTFWYKFSNPYKMDGSGRKTPNTTWLAHWNALNIALSPDRNIEIIGFLKDRETQLCSLTNTFKCGLSHYRESDGAIWIQLHPQGEIGCGVGVFNREGLFSHLFLADIQKTFERQVLDASNLDAEKRAERLRLAPKKPETRAATTTVFIRNPDVVAEVLYRAKGVCQKCGKRAPFTRLANGEPYLEVHHRTRLADGGHDTVENAEALCPNCHRAKHFGIPDA